MLARDGMQTGRHCRPVLEGLLLLGGLPGSRHARDSTPQWICRIVDVARIRAGYITGGHSRLVAIKTA